MTNETFTRGMTLLAAIWPERKMSEDTVAAYWMALSDLSDESFINAIEQICKESIYYPRPAEIRMRAIDPVERRGKREWWDDPQEVAKMERLMKSHPRYQRIRARLDAPRDTGHLRGGSDG